MQIKDYSSYMSSSLLRNVGPIAVGRGWAPSGAARRGPKTLLAHKTLLAYGPRQLAFGFLNLELNTVMETHVLNVCASFLTCCGNTCAFRGDCGPSDLPISLSVHCLDHDAFVFALCQDHKLRMWSYKVSEAWAQGAAPSFSAWVMF